MRRGARIALAVAALAAGPARAQAPAEDPIDALLRHKPAAVKVIPPEEPDTAAAGSRVEPDVPAPVPPPRAGARRPPALGAPVRVEETGKSPDGPPTAADVAYDNRIRAGLAAAEGFMGPLDGGWTVLGGGGRELYVLQLADRNGEVQGAWRDPRRAGQPASSGLIDEILREGADVRFRIGSASGRLHPAADGRWTGELTEGGRTESVTLARRNP
jgi:hypothetical protein